MMRFAPVLWTSAILMMTAAFASGAYAEKITLTSQDRSVSVTGELISFDGETYVISGALGNISLDANLVICVGDNCPSLLDETKMTIAVADGVDAELVTNLVQYFALVQDLTLSIVSSPEPNAIVYSLSTQNGQPYVDITVKRGLTAAEALSAGSGVMAITTSPLSSDQKQAVQAAVGDAPNPYVENALALDGIAVVVAPSNPVSTLTSKQLADIFTGRVTNWSQLGGANVPIRTLAIADAMAPDSFFSRTVTGGNYGRNVEAVPDATELNVRVSGDPGAIGFASFGDVSGVKPVAIAGECGISARADMFGILSGQYPLSSNVYVIDSGAEHGQPQQEFLDFLATDAALSAAEQAGFIQDAVVARPIAEQGNRLLDMILTDEEGVALNKMRQVAKDFRGATRLSTTFRFVQGVSRMDGRNLRELQSLASYLIGQDLSGKEILVAGFTDSVGSAASNAQASRRRADFVAGELRAALGNAVPVVAKGYGEVSPLACNSSEGGRDINRRVEIWIRDAR